MTWEQLRFQFGSQCADNRFGRAKFKDMFTKQLAHVLIVYPEANAEATAQGIVLKPSRTHVPFRGLRALTSE